MIPAISFISLLRTRNTYISNFEKDLQVTFILDLIDKIQLVDRKP